MKTLYKWSVEDYHRIIESGVLYEIPKCLLRIADLGLGTGDWGLGEVKNLPTPTVFVSFFFLFHIRRQIC